MKIKRHLKTLLARIPGWNRARKDYSTARIEYLRGKGMRIGEGTHLFDTNILIDESCPYLIRIGKNVNITRGVTILTHGYDWSVLKAVYGDVLGGQGPVTIGDNVFIGVGSTILKNVTIGDHTIIAAGSVVCSGTYPPNSILAGVPARVIGTIDQYYQKRRDAQFAEARAMAQAYAEVEHKMPPKEFFREYFWLFEPRGEIRNETFLAVQKLMGNEPQSMARFQETEPMFESYEAFLQACFAQAGSGDHPPQKA